ncbi:AAA family ATPase [Actinoplanes sp. NPDC051411]|uniref:NACHT domain-containing protein n=1 Tax=Actinoplanes sp. NPDC051411 TaxID=3155522 RepID=UPI00342AF733
MSRGLRYSDAVTLLGGSGPLLRAADRVAGAALTLATAGGSDLALGLFDARSEAVRLSEAALGRLSDSVRGLRRYDRTQRLQAAHGVLVVTAFFAALDECLAAARVESPGFSRDDQLMVATARPGSGWVAALLDADLPVPSADRTAQALLREITSWAEASGSRLLSFLRGLAEWDLADDRARRSLTSSLPVQLPPRAASLYLESARRLAGDIPEFGIWLGQLETHAVGQGLQHLEALLRPISSHFDPSAQRAALASANRAVLAHPVLGGEVLQPSLGDAYLDPRFQVKAAGPGARPADDPWWDAGVRNDFGDFLATYLTTPAAAEAPMLLLGQPGAGKSSLTRILAARLPAADYLVVRVPLREVRAEAEVQDQIEQAIRSAIGETVSWPALARDAGRAQPLILLDGFDELLQATGVHQSDYLQRVSDFQRREATLDRPVAVIVTSRVAVADRARLPLGALAVRLEPFDEPQVARWRELWNAADPARRPLSLSVLRRFPDLASQPLMLLMLALFDASTAELADLASLDTGQLYERLLSEFARREVARSFSGPDSALPRLVDQELLRLSVVAFAMFHRGRLWVTEAELDHDLAGLGFAAAPPASGGFRTPLTAGQELVGRFFFIQRAQAQRDGQPLQAYEFLHATFGEYLVARLTVQALTDAVARDAAGTLALQPRDDDDLLSSLLGYTPLTARATVLPFVTAMIDGPATRPWLIDRLRSAVLRPQWKPRAYQPVDRRTDFWTATYSFNLTLLVLACGLPLHASELWQHAADPAYWMRITARLWTAAVPSSMWLDSLAPITISRTWSPDRRRDIVLTAAGRPAPTRVDLLWSFRRHPDDPPAPALSGFNDDTSFDIALRAMALDGYLSTDLLRHALEPLIAAMPSALTEVVVHGPGDASSIARTLLDVWLAGLSSDDAQLGRAYARAIEAVSAGRAPSQATALLGASLDRDAARLPTATVTAWRAALAAGDQAALPPA